MANQGRVEIIACGADGEAKGYEYLPTDIIVT